MFYGLRAPKQILCLCNYLTLWTRLMMNYQSICQCSSISSPRLPYLRYFSQMRSVLVLYQVLYQLFCIYKLQLTIGLQLGRWLSRSIHLNTASALSLLLHVQVLHMRTCDVFNLVWAVKACQDMQRVVCLTGLFDRVSMQTYPLWETILLRIKYYQHSLPHQSILLQSNYIYEYSITHSSIVALTNTVLLTIFKSASQQLCNIIQGQLIYASREKIRDRRTRSWIHNTINLLSLGSTVSLIYHRLCSVWRIQELHGFLWTHGQQSQISHPHMIETYYHISATHHYSTVYSDEKEAYYSLLMGIIVSQSIQNGTQSRLPNISDRSQFQNSYSLESWFDCLKITIIILLPPTMHSSSSNHPISTPSPNSNPPIDHNDKLKEHLLMQSHNGKHRCPKPHVKGDFQTNYNNHYRPIHQKVNVQPPPKYQYKQRHYRPEALMTRYQQTFIKKQPYLNEDLNKSRLQNVGKTIVRPHVPFDTTTSYTDQYRPYSLQHPNNPEDLYINSRDKIPDYAFQSPAKFDDHTAYRQYFAAPSPPKLQKSPYPQYKKPEVAFSGDSRYKEDYKQYKIVQPKYESYSQSLSQVPKVKFEDHTAYKDHYKSFEVKQQPMYSGKGCVLQKMELPKTNFLNSSAHVYIDPAKARLCE